MPANGLFYISFFDNLDDHNTQPDEIDTEHCPGVSFKLLTEYLRLY